MLRWHWKASTGGGHVVLVIHSKKNPSPRPWMHRRGRSERAQPGVPGEALAQASHIRARHQCGAAERGQGCLGNETGSQGPRAQVGQYSGVGLRGRVAIRGSPRCSRPVCRVGLWWCCLLTSAWLSCVGPSLDTEEAPTPPLYRPRT